MSDPIVQTKIAHSAKNFIDIDASSSSSDNDDSETTDSSNEDEEDDEVADQEANPDTSRRLTAGGEFAQKVSDSVGPTTSNI